MTIKNSLLLLLLSCFGFLSYGQNDDLTELIQNYDSEQDADEFYLDVPQKDDALEPFDTSNIPAEYSHVILDKKVNCYSYLNKRVKGSAMVIRSTYIRNINGVASIIDKNISKNKKYGVTIFKADGEKIHFTEELKQKEFDEKLKKELRPGDIIRFYYLYAFTKINNFSYIMSETVPVHNATFIMQAEDKIEFTAKGLNGMESTMDSTIEGFQILEFKGEDLPIVRNEKFTASNASMAKVTYSLAYQRHATEDRLFDFTYASRAYKNYYKTEDVAIEAFTVKIYSKLDIEKGDDDDAKAKKIDDYMKEHFIVINFNFGFKIDLKKIFGDEYLSPDDAFKYYVSLLKRADIETEIALLPNRLNHKLDPEFETWEYFQYETMYLPSTKKYVYPKHEQYFYGQMPPQAKDNEAVYVLDHKFGDIESSKFVLRELKANGHKENIESLNLSIDLNNTHSVSTFSKSYQGDFAMSFNNSFKDLHFDDKENIFSNSCKLIDPMGIPTTEYSFDNSKEDSFAITGDFYANGLILNNGTEIEIGKLLGQKEELSSPAKRQAQFAILPQTRNVTINITLPNDKKATNLNDFKASYSDEEFENSPIAYKLSASQEGDVVSITLKEVFKKTVYDKAEYPEIKEMFDLANKIYSKKLIIQ